jgi:hypothetical protein
MLVSIQLNDELRLDAHEIRDVVADGMLAAKVDA